MRLLSSSLLRACGVPHGFGVRTGGVSTGPCATLNLGLTVGDAPAHVAENRRRFFVDAGIDEARVPELVQVHGDRIVFARVEGDGLLLAALPAGPPLAAFVEADAVVAAPGAAAAVRVADCVPVLLYDPDSGAAAAVHAGWRGTASHIVAKAVEALGRAHGARPQVLRAVIGPAIGRCCYEVGDDLARRFEADPAFGAAVVRRDGARPHLDLAEANRRLLEGAGLKADHVEALGLCTACDGERFFSHRRDAGRTGRHLAAIAAGRF